MKLKQILTEYLSTNISKLYRYLLMSHEDHTLELPYEYFDQWPEFCRRSDHYPEFRSLEFRNDLNDITVDDLEHRYPAIFKYFANYLYKQIESYKLEPTPIWFGFEDPQLVKKQWLVHFSDKADQIVASKGFKGVTDTQNLLITANAAHRSLNDGYAFAYAINDLSRDNVFSEMSFVLFMSQGIKVYHYYDSEHQVIFFAGDATNLVYVNRDRYDGYTIRNKKTNAILYQNEDIEKTIDWIITNYNQYKKYL